MRKIDFSKLTPIDLMVGEDAEETEQLKNLYGKACTFIKSFRWSGEIKTVFFGIGAADIISIFLFEIIPNAKEVDSFLWVVVGDIPSAYLVVDNAPNPACALDSYIGEMSKWVKAVLKREPISDLIPVDAAPTIDNAYSLKNRLEFLDKEILNNYSDDLKM